MKCLCGHVGPVSTGWETANENTFRKIRSDNGFHFPGEGSVDLFYCPKCGALKASVDSDGVIEEDEE